MFTFNFHLPTKIIFCENAFREKLGEEAARFGGRALIVTGGKSSSRSGSLKVAESALAERKIKCEIFAGVTPNVMEADVVKGAEAMKKFKPDCIIALGGGSALDAAKGIAVLAKFGGRVEDYFGADLVPGPIAPLIAVPTTAGTGSEVTRYSLITVPKKKLKGNISSPEITPRVAIVDPILTRTLSADIAAATGVDAFSHAVESLTGAAASPVTELLSLEAISVITEALPVSVNLQGDVEGRCKMSYAATLAGVGINNTGTGIAHGMSYPLTVEYGVPHGVAVGLVLPHVMEFNMPARRREFAAMAEAMGENTDFLSPAEAADLSVAAVKRLLRDIRFPVSLAEFGIEKKDLKRYAKNMMKESVKLARNARMPEEKDLVAIYLRAAEEGLGKG